MEIVETKLLNSKTFDPFENLKCDFFEKSVPLIKQVFEKMLSIRHRNDEESFTYLLKVLKQFHFNTPADQKCFINIFVEMFS